MDFVGPGGGKIPADNREDIRQWHSAIQATGRPIHLELSNSLSIAEAATWQRYSNGWADRRRHRVLLALRRPHELGRAGQAPLRRRSPVDWLRGPGHWNDLDSVEIGNGEANGITPTSGKAS
ncbi:hypothetical protein ACFPN7_48575 [Amycolatopsis halotolerans]|uniref:hypothetical protein n=1 Tax=Amycolatopsis halotolerans TaxID=330083 RepID=UPI00360EC316